MRNELQQYPVPASYEELKSAYLDLARLHDRALKQHKDTVEFLREKFILAMRKKYGPSADQVVGELFNEAEVTESFEEAFPGSSQELGGSKQRKKKRPAIPDNFPKQQEIHDLEEAQKFCPHDGAQLREMGVETTQEVSYTPSRIKVIEHVYKKYCCSECDSYIASAPRIKRAIPGIIGAPDLLAYIAVAKYIDHLPLYRQEAILDRNGFSITRATMAAWMIKLGEVLIPISNLLFDQVINSPVVQCDETPVRVLTVNGTKTTKKSYFWAMTAPSHKHRIVYYEYDSTRSSSVPKRLFADYKGFIQVDGYGGYDAYFRGNDAATRVACMAHIRRNFTDYLKIIPKDERAKHPAFKIKDRIDRLYAIEDAIRGRPPDERHAVRREKSRPLFNELEKFIEAEATALAPRSKYGDALAYAKSELPLLRNYLDHGFIEIDNNLVENSIRPIALGKKNWLFSETDVGADASARIYTILRTAVLNGLNPINYLTEVLEKIPYCETANEFEQLLPFPKSI